jgi:hypothetical protein
MLCGLICSISSKFLKLIARNAHDSLLSILDGQYRALSSLALAIQQRHLTASHYRGATGNLSPLLSKYCSLFYPYAMLTGTWANQTILGSQFLLPEGPVKPIYYMALITELCKLSPQTVGPAVGKSIRKIYGYCASGLDVEVLRRFSEWFSVHMSNFGFQWVWKEWSVPSTQSASRVLKRRQGSRSGIADATSKTSLCAASAGTRDSVVIL